MIAGGKRGWRSRCAKGAAQLFHQAFDFFGVHIDAGSLHKLRGIEVLVAAQETLERFAQLVFVTEVRQSARGVLIRHASTLVRSFCSGRVFRSGLVHGIRGYADPVRHFQGAP